MNKIIKYLIIFALILIAYGCKDEKLTMQRSSYLGNDIRLDGYYYNQRKNSGSPPRDYTTVFFLYRNGIILNAHSYIGTNLDVVEKEMINQYEALQNQKIGWGIFIVTGNQIEYEQWSTSVGGGLPVFKNNYIIENDTTLINSWGEIYHFRQFSPKPDSTNNFIK